MIESDAVEIAKGYAATWDVPADTVANVRVVRRWWGGLWGFIVTFETGLGVAKAAINAATAHVIEFDHVPRVDGVALVPMWAAFPTYSSVTSGWRQGTGEPYKYRWYAFYRSLSDDRRAAYRGRFPPPDDARNWRGFYDDIADRPANGGVADFVLGRV